MTDTTTEITVSDDRAKAETFAKALFWIGPACFVLAMAIGGFASQQFNGSGLTMFAIALLPTGAISMLLWLVVCALDTTRPR